MYVNIFNENYRIVINMHYIKVAIAKAHTSRRLFTYSSSSVIKSGSVIKVPFGKKTVIGIVISQDSKPQFAVKNIYEVTTYRLPNQSVSLMLWMFEYYPDDFGIISQLFLPNQLTAKPKPYTTEAYESTSKPLLKPTSEQQLALDIIKKNRSRILLHGDTGSGKTRVFLEAAKRQLDNGKSVMILTPEIGLTPQLVDELKKYLNYPVVLSHSSLTNAHRQSIWQYALASAKPTVYVGPRSALFLPISNLGLIVIDEAHDSSYKQSQAPRYYSLHVAGQLANLHHAQLIQSTATPNVEDYETAKAHKFTIARMKETAAGTKTSHIHIVDATKRDNFTTNPNLSDGLIEAMDIALKNKQQSMLFLNRRGSARLIQCSQCGWQAVCPNCNLSLVYHHDLHQIKCHTCGHHQTVILNCPVCNNIDIQYKSIGTKALAESVQKLFPTAVLKRFDADSINEDQYYKNIDSLKTGGVDIIIGTQIITKGIDLPKLSVVGIVSADTSLNLPDYRAEEITFQQLYQASGRAIRGHQTSKIFIQTRLAEHKVVSAVKHRSWEEFYRYEIKKRRRFHYPPFCFLSIFKIYKKTPRLAEQKSQAIAELLRREPNLSVLGPSPSFYEKTKRGWAWQIVVKSKQRSTIIQASQKLPKEWIIDTDSVSIL